MLDSVLSDDALIMPFKAVLKACAMSLPVRGKKVILFLNFFNKKLAATQCICLVMEPIFEIL